MWQDSTTPFSSIDTNTSTSRAGLSALPSAQKRAACIAGRATSAHSDAVSSVSFAAATASVGEEAAALEWRKARQLIMRYRQENERLREQIKAHTLRESLLMDQVTRLARASQQLQQQSQSGHLMMVNDLNVMGATGSTDNMTNTLAAKEERIASLTIQVRELQGRLVAYEEALARPNAASLRTSPSLTGDASAQQGGVEEEAGVSVQEILCQCLSGTGYITRVFNAVDHCRNTPHKGDELQMADLSSLVQPTLCSRERDECTTKCLQAAVRGNTESHADIMRRGYNISSTELAVALREELLYSERCAVRLAAQLLQAQREKQHKNAVADVSDGKNEAHQEGGAGTLDVDCSSFDGEPETKENSAEEEEDLRELRVRVQELRSRRKGQRQQRHQQSQVEVEDCAVQ